MSNFYVNNGLIDNLVSPASSNTSNNNILTNFYDVNNNPLQFLKPQGNTDIFKSSWESNLTLYTINGNDIFDNFAPYTTVYNTSGAHTHTLKNTTVRWAALLVAGGGGGMGGTQYNGGANGAGGGGGSSGQWLFAYSNVPITNRTLNITIGSGGKGSIGVDSTSSYQYPLTQPTTGGNSSIVINGTTILLVNGGNTGQGFTAGNVGSLGGVANATSITVDNSMMIYDYTNGVNGSNGSNATSGHPPGGSGGINSFSSIQINNYFRYINASNTEIDIVLTDYGVGGNGGYGEGTSGSANGCHNGFDASGGLAVIFEYQFPSTFTTTLATSKLITGTSSNLINLINQFNTPYGYNYINLCLYGAGGNAGQVGSGAYDSGGAGSGAFIYAKNIPIVVPNTTTTITNIQYVIGTGGSSQSTIVIIYYSDGSYIKLNAGAGQSTGYTNSTNGAPGGVASNTITSTFYSTSNIFMINGAKGGNKTVTGASSGYTSSGSGSNSSNNPVSNSSHVSNTFNANDGKKYTITSVGGGSNQIVSGYGAGGAATPANYNQNAPAYRYGSQGCILYMLDVNASSSSPITPL